MRTSGGPLRDCPVRCETEASNGNAVPDSSPHSISWVYPQGTSLKRRAHALERCLMRRVPGTRRCHSRPVLDPALSRIRTEQPPSGRGESPRGLGDRGPESARCGNVVSAAQLREKRPIGRGGTKITADTARMTCARNMGSQRRVIPTAIETGSRPERPHPTKETEVVSTWSKRPGKERDAKRWRALL